MLRVDGVFLSANNDKWLNFSANDYLGLAAEPAVAAALSRAAGQCGSGSGASALVTGYHPEHQALEQELAEFQQRDAVLLCSSGYLANLAVATSLAGRHDRIVQDRLCHASLIDGARLSGARLQRYQHADTAHAQRLLAKPHEGHSLLVSDGVFSMDGDIAPLPQLAQLAGQHDATLVVDDAHGIGVLGDCGRGATELAGLGQQQVPVLVGTLGKALGGSGAFIAGSAQLVEHLVNEARSYIYNTALPPSLAAAARVALKFVQDEPWRRERLHQRIAQLRDGARARGIVLKESHSPIQPLLVGDEAATLALSAALSDKGYKVIAIRPPTVPVGTSRLRITLSALHEPAHVEGLLDALESCLPSR
jgi:8-amino-7-oxononanoate synthase